MHVNIMASSVHPFVVPYIWLLLHKWIALKSPMCAPESAVATASSSQIWETKKRLHSSGHNIDNRKALRRCMLNFQAQSICGAAAKYWGQQKGGRWKPWYWHASVKATLKKWRQQYKNYDNGARLKMKQQHFLCISSNLPKMTISASVQNWSGIIPTDCRKEGRGQRV